MFPISSITPLWIAARKLLEAHGEEFFLLWGKVAKGFGVEDIHDLRVASRRLQEGLALFAPCFPDKELSRIGKQVKRVTGILGDLRNTDESALFFSTLDPKERRQADLEVQGLLAHLKKEREAARRRLKGDLNALKPGALRSALDATLHQPELFGNDRVDPFQGFSQFADAAIAARAQPLGELLTQALDEVNISAQHRLRIAIKKMRYRLEILEPLFKSGFPELHNALKGYQEVLGKLHDLDVFADMVRERIPEGTARQSLLRAVAARRSGVYASFIGMLGSFSVDTIGAQARSFL
jgi:CHAD domain-containing protein